MYATLGDIKRRLPEDTLMQLTDDGNLGEIGAVVVDAAIEAAESEIDTYLGGRYSVPLASPAPPLIVKCSCAMAIYTLYSRKMEQIPETRETAYRDAVKTLEKIARGDIRLPVDEETASGTPDFVSGIITSDRPVVS